LRETSKGRFRKGMGRRTTDAATLPCVEQIYNVRPLRRTKREED
jgi:hypothetical protein